jgi:hypothetical protein
MLIPSRTFDTRAKARAACNQGDWVVLRERRNLFGPGSTEAIYAVVTPMERTALSLQWISVERKPL